jgi:hypothetical protein
VRTRGTSSTRTRALWSTGQRTRRGQRALWSTSRGSQQIGLNPHRSIKVRHPRKPISRMASAMLPSARWARTQLLSSRRGSQQTEDHERAAYSDLTMHIANEFSSDELVSLSVLLIAMTPIVASAED